MPPIRDNSLTYYAMESITICLGYSLVFQTLAVLRNCHILSDQVAALTSLIIVGFSVGIWTLRFAQFHSESGYVHVNTLQKVRLFWLALVAIVGGLLGVLSW